MWDLEVCKEILYYHTNILNDNDNTSINKTRYPNTNSFHLKFPHKEVHMELASIIRLQEHNIYHN